MEMFLGKKYVLTNPGQFKDYIVYVKSAHADFLMMFSFTVFKSNGGGVIIKTEYIKRTAEHIRSGVGYEAGYTPSKKALDLTQTHILTRNNDGTYKFHFICPVANNTITFTPGVEFELENADGLKMKMLITINDNVMTQTQSVRNGEYEKTTEHVREFYADKMISTTYYPRTKKIEKRYYVVEN